MEEPDEPTRWFEPPIPSLTAEESAAARAPFFSPAFPPPPAIRYACACLHELTPPTRDADRSNNSIDRSDAPPSTPFGLWTLEDLLFCPSCNALKCPRCVNEELQDAYCPACLFDMVMTNVARVERNRCIRHCFQCPLCTSSCSVIPIAPPAPQPGTPDPTAPESNEPKEKYIVQCNHCLWDSSKTPGWTFEKPTGLGAFAATAETRSPQAVAFGSLKQHFAAGLPQPEKEKKGQSKVVQLLAKASRKFGTGRGKEVEPRKVEKKEWSDPTHSAYVEIEGTDEERAEAYEKWLSEKAAAERTAALLARDENRVTTPEQRLAQPTQPFSNVGLIPPRTPLRFKKIKRCATCTGILTRPEQKAANTKWRVKNVARDVVPRVTIVPPIPEGEGVLVLRFANPADVEVEVTLRPQVDTVRPLVTKFTVPPKQEEGLYDPQPFLEPEELFLVVKRGGRVERKNWTAVAVELGETREFWMRMELRGAKVPGAWVWVSV